MKIVKYNFNIMAFFLKSFLKNQSSYRMQQLQYCSSNLIQRDL